MTVRGEMVTAARRGAPSLKPTLAATVAFVADRFTPDGFRGRSRDGDLYYTVFGIETLLALGACVPAGVRPYLESFAAGEALDLVHAACLARCRAAMPEADSHPAERDALADRIRTLAAAGGKNDTAYGWFLATMALQDLGTTLPDPQAACNCLETLAAPGGGFANHRAWPRATVPSTAAAMVALTHLGRTLPEHCVAWLARQQSPTGGFTVAPSVPEADLLSTAVALHALAVTERPLRDDGRCRRFVLGLRRQDGGFAACAADRVADIEYTWYALLALGHLAG